MNLTGNILTRTYKNISDEKREDIIKALENGETTRRDVAKHFNVSYVSVAKIYNDFCKTGKISKSKVGGKKPKKLSPDQIMFLKSLLVEDCTLTLKVLKAKIFSNFSISICEATISKYIENCVRHVTTNMIRCLSGVNVFED